MGHRLSRALPRERKKARKRNLKKKKNLVFTL